MDVTLRLDPGRRAEFGQVGFTGGEGIDTDFLRARIPIEAGQRYEPTLVTDGQNNLFDTNLFSTIVPRPATTLTADQRLDLVYDLKQRPPRSIGAELNYEIRRSAPGSGCSGSIATSSAPASGSVPRSPASEPQQSLTIGLRKPDFLRPNQSLLTDLSVRRDRLDAYDADSIGAGVGSSARSASSSSSRSAPALRYARIDATQEPEESFLPALAARQDRLGFRQRPVQPDQRRDAGCDRGAFRGSARHRPPIPQGSHHHHALPVT